MILNRNSLFSMLVFEYLIIENLWLLINEISYSSNSIFGIMCKCINGEAHITRSIKFTWKGLKWYFCIWVKGT